MNEENWNNTAGAQSSAGEAGETLNVGLYCCADWESGIRAIDEIIILHSLRAGKDLYTGKQFSFCPWCGASKQSNE
ncbi:hypothetical protein UFOVP1155_51 [uncultured Caudovirales phage]|uniref:Uncharacterized protein n=1 Tax=uncultured Caudovirales phage TaxID=2100421 RepID=A0A6J5QSK4_9CAUD|nr:hypothetical protein UFOVP1155_51 [uncultured Caudovirales phage]